MAIADDMDTALASVEAALMAETARLAQTYAAAEAVVHQAAAALGGTGGGFTQLYLADQLDTLRDRIGGVHRRVSHAAEAVRGYRLRDREI